MKQFDVQTNYRKAIAALINATVLTILATDGLSYWLSGFTAGVVFMWLLMTWYIHQTQMAMSRRQTGN